MNADESYPLRIEGTLDPGLSRWLWLVKWLLAIPHFIVLAFLWLAFVIFTVVAFFAILFTGRYPRGHLRLQCRRAPLDVAGRVLTNGALGTDRYPPFTLDEPRLPGHARRRLPRAALARTRPGQVVAARDPALHRRRLLPRRARVGRPRRRRRTSARRRHHRRPRLRRRRRPALHRPVSVGSSTSCSASTAGSRVAAYAG